MNKRGMIHLVFAVGFTLAAFLGACGNPLEGGSEPSGSILRVTDNESSAIQDIFFCEGEDVEYASMEFTVENQSTPNFEDSITTADGTNSFVTLNRITINYTVTNLSATIPSVEMAFTTGIDKDDTADITMPIMNESVLEFIRANYPMVGNGQSMTVRVDVTYWGVDAFDVDVSVMVSTTLVVDDFSPCQTDLIPTDESEESSE